MTFTYPSHTTKGCVPLSSDVSGSIKIIVQNEKKINLDAMLIGTESFIEYMKKNGVPIQENKGND